jgi:hypothetical protein
MDLQPEPIMIRAFLRQEVGIDPNDAAVVLLDLASLGITSSAWRNSPLEDWHSQGRIHDGGMLRANVATTKLVLEVFADYLGEDLDDEEDVITATEDFADFDSDFTDELFIAIFERLSDPDRVLPDGRTLLQLAGEDLDELTGHMDTTIGGIAASAERDGLDFALQRADALAGWRADTGGEHPGGQTSWPSFLLGWTTRGIRTGARLVTFSHVCRPSLPRSPTGPGSGPCYSIALNCCRMRARSSASLPASVTFRSPSRHGGPRTARETVPEPARMVSFRSRIVHLSQQNTATRRLTKTMLNAVFLRARELLSAGGE